MGHCISVFLIRKEELRNEKIDSIIDKISEQGESSLTKQEVAFLESYREKIK